MKISDLAKKMISTILIIAIVCILASVIYYRSLEFLPFIFGVLLGTATSVAKVLLLEHTVNKALKMEESKAGGYVTLQHIFRLLLSGVVLVLGAIIPQVNLWGVVVGILALQVAIYLSKFTSKSGV